ncbi:MAG: anthranilate phosphoribosyltransferase [Planctomycetota bacterium]|jgi:anthranilate phosphoribosyltransferase
MNIQEALREALAGQSIDSDSMRELVACILAGEGEAVAFGGLLVALAARGETTDEILGAARAMRSAMLPFEHDCPEAIDTCGTGGSGLDTFNVSTASAIVAAAAGAKVIKHGNRSSSSKCGSADLLEALGIPLELSPSAAREVLQEVGITFLYAPTYHPAMRHAGPIRKSLGVRTIFNLLGPLCNPGGVKRQLLGVFDPSRVDDLQEVLSALGSERALVVHGGGGADELTLAGQNLVRAVGDLPEEGFDPADLKLAISPIQASSGGDAQENMATLRRLFDAEDVPARGLVLLNTSAALVVAGKASSSQEGYELARETIDSGAAKSTLSRWCQVASACGDAK